MSTTIKAFIFTLVLGLLSQIITHNVLALIVVCIVSGYVFQQKGMHTLFIHFISGLLLWSIYALIIDNQNEHILSVKISTLFFQQENSILLILVTGVIGGIVAGVSSLIGHSLKKVI